MYPSDLTPAPTGVTRLPEATREQQLDRWGLPGNTPVGLRPSWSGFDGDDGPLAPHQDAASRHGLSHEAIDFVRGGGWSIVSIRDGDESGGLTSHRGVLHPHEYVDADRLRDLVEEELGFTYLDIHSVYSTGGRIANHLFSLRDRIDARLLEIAQEGANMDAFGRVVGVNSRTLDRALARARSAEEVAA